MKSQVNAILHVVHGLLADVRAAYPTVVGLDRDYSRLSRLCQYRGLGVLSLDLPVLSDLLLEGLKTGHLPDIGNPFGWKSKQVRVPRLFAGLWLRVFDKQSNLKPDADVNAVMFLYALSTIGKKVKHDCSTSRQKETMKGYINVENQIRPPSLDWQGDSICSPEGDLSGIELAQAKVDDLPLFPDLTVQDPGRVTYLLNRMQQVADVIVGSMLPFDPVIWSDVLMEYEGISGLRHGTGAVAERIGKDGKSKFFSWPHKLNTVFPYSQFGGCLNDDHRPNSVESPSQLHMVPKTLKGPRIIAAEPVAHQWCQGLVLNFLVFEFSRLFDGDFIDLKAQHKSAGMVLKASRDGSLATVDLSDASDRLSCFVVERVFRRNPPLLRALHAARTRFVRLDAKRNELLCFKKFASQGTGVTFPVQSLVFLCAAIAVSLRGRVSLKSIKRLRKTVRVYGDDIIIPTHGYAGLKILLETLGLKVNERKSFATGEFRESCGTDGFRGIDITPCKPQIFMPGSPSDVIAMVDESNNLFKKGMWHASLSLSSGIPSYAMRRIRVTGPDVAGSFGLYSFSGSDGRHLRRRWNHHYQREEQLVFAVNASTSRAQRDGYARLVDLSTMPYSPGFARTVSAMEHRRYAKGGVRWEPSYQSH
jgi:hypothetical protein